MPSTIPVSILARKAGYQGWRHPAAATGDVGTALVEVGNQLWVGSFRGNRIAIVPAP
jgi:hypothetical protein